MGTIFFLVLLARSAGGPGPFGGDKPAGRSADTPAGVLCAGLRLVWTRLVEKVDLPISASLGGVPATCMGAVLQTMISLG